MQKTLAKIYIQLCGGLVGQMNRKLHILDKNNWKYTILSNIDRAKFVNLLIRKSLILTISSEKKLCDPPTTYPTYSQED